MDTQPMWIDTASLDQFARQVDTHGGAMLQSVPVALDRFSTPDGRPHTDLIIARAAGGGYAALVPAGLTPRNSDLGPAFARSEVADGWRVLAVGRASTIEDALRLACSMLGVTYPIGRDNTPDMPTDYVSREHNHDGSVRVPAGTARTPTDSPAPHERPFTHNLTAEARAGRLNSVYGRDSELDQVLTVLLQKGQNCPILIGEPGVGKTVVANKLAIASVTEGGLPRRLHGMAVISLDTAELLAASGTVGGLEGHLKELFESFEGSRDVLFIDEFHALASVRGSGPSAFDLMKPRLTRGVRVLAATTQSEFQVHVASDEALARRFCPVVVDEPSPEETERILNARLPALMAHHQISVDVGSVAEIVRLADEFLRGGHRPHKSLSLLDRAMAMEALQADRSSA